MGIHHDTYSAVQPGKPGSAMYPQSPLGEKVEGIPTAETWLGSRWWITDETAFLKRPSTEPLLGRTATKSSIPSEATCCVMAAR